MSYCLLLSSVNMLYCLQHMPEKLQLKIAKEKQTSITLMNENRNIKSAYLEEVNKMLNDLPNQVR